MQLQLFDPTKYNSHLFNNFLQSELGQLYLAIPFKELADPYRGIKGKSGPKGNFTIEGGIGLMVLKSYLGHSDQKLIDRLNTDWHLQLFCGLPKKDDHGIKDGDVVHRWREFFGKNLDLEAFQSCMARHWGGGIAHKNLCVMDASLYESYIKYPTDWNLLWDCCAWLRKLMKALCGACGLRMPRSRFKEQAGRQMAFSKRRRKTHGQKRKRVKQLLYLLGKLLGQLDGEVLPAASGEVALSARQQSRLAVVREVLGQQREIYEKGPDAEVGGRIVSLFKPYVRPVVRGKERKRTEFGAKVHMVHVGRICFIEKLAHEAFHEGVRMNQAIALHTKLFGRPSQASADRLYATNANRRMCSSLCIATGFDPKGRRAADEKGRAKLRQAINRERATALEGDFGNHKNHYGLGRIRARTEATEMAWIVFGVWTANAMKIVRSRQKAAKAA